MKKVLLFFLLVFFSKGIYSQSYLDNYNYIPLVTFGGGCNYNDLIWYDYSQIKLMGSDIFVAMEPWAEKFDLLRNADIKLIVSQSELTNNRPNYISKYTDAIYSVWEAESVPISEGEIQLSRYLSIVNDSTEHINTKSNTSGYILDGPDYMHRLNYAVETDKIKYFAKFILKVESTNTPTVQLANNNDIICRIELTSNDSPLGSKEITAHDFFTYSAWKEFEIDYSLTENLALESGTPVQINTFYAGPNNKDIDIYSNIEFKVYYYGTDLDYLSLYVDKVICYDDRGQALINTTFPTQRIIEQANNTGTFTKFANDPTHFNNTVKGWYAVDEPSFIDNWACVKKVAEILKYNANGRKLVTTIAGSWNGRVYDGSNVYRIDELMKRANLEEVIMDNFIYNYPSNVGDQNYKEYNINNMLLNHLDRLNNYDIPFVLNLQTGLWFADEDLLEVIPSSAQFKNTAYLGLLYGAKGLGISKYFYNSSTDGITTGLFRVDINYLQHTYQPLWSTIKNELSPILKGRFGQTIRNLDQKYQVCNYPADMGTIISDSFWLKRIKTNLPPLEADQCRVDYGFFEDPNNLSYKYLMIVNRYYSTMTELDITIKNLQGFRNWKIENFISDNSQTVFSNAADEVTFNDIIDQGEAGFYSILPVLKYGGNLVYDDTVKTAIALAEAMTIKPNADLTIEALYNIAEDIYVEDGGTVKTQHPGGITFSNGAKLNFEDWSDCLVVSQNSGHPKLHWNEYTGESQQIKYEIYRKKNTQSFELIHTITDKSVIEYIDTGVQIIFSQQANMTTAEYYIKLYELPSKNWVQTDQTNIALVNQVQGIAPDKKGAEGNEIIKPTTFVLEQNHPNPFNPTTVITYQVPKQSHVTIKVYDIIGKEITELVNSTKAAGIYSVTFDASNLSSGTYIYRMEAGKYSESRKMIILK